MNWLHKWLGRCRPSHPRAGRRKRRLGLETLEGRLVPTVLIEPHFAGTFQTSSSSENPFTLQNEPVVLIFAGSWWQSAAGRRGMQTLTRSVQTILASPYLGGLQQYGSDGKAHLFAVTTNRQALAVQGNEPAPTELLNFVGTVSGAQPQIVPHATGNPQELPLYCVVNDPMHSGAGRSTCGLNWPDDNFSAIYMGTRFLSPGRLNVDGFTQVFSHELVEATTSAITVNDPGHRGGGDQIADNEPEANRGYAFRVNGMLVQAYWSGVDQAWIVPDGRTVWTVLEPIWINSRFTGSYRVASPLTHWKPLKQPIESLAGGLWDS